MPTFGSSNQNFGRGPNQDAGGALIFFGGLGFLVFTTESIAAVFTASFAAGVAALLVIAVVVLLAIALYRKQQRISLALVLLGLVALWAALGGGIVFINHWLAFTPAARVLDCLFVAALVSGAWSAINQWLKLIAALLLISLVTATGVLPRPPGGEGPYDTAEQWHIDVTVKDDKGQPLQSALVLCGTVMMWEHKLALAETLAKETDSNGQIPTWEFDEDPSLKTIICTAWKNANEGNAGYPASSQLVLSPTGGGDYKLEFTLVENPHPDTAFLTFDLSGDYEQAWYTLQFELWAGDPVGDFGSHESGEQPEQVKSWKDLRGSGFTIPAATAMQDFQVRYYYEGPNGPELGPPYSEVRIVHVGAIEPGTRKRLSLRIPDR